MKKSKLLHLLSSFTKEDYRSFTDFVASPFFNKKKDVITFYAYLKKRAPEFSDDFIERQFVYKTLYPNQAYDEKHIGYLMSYLTKLVEQFMGIRKYQQDDLFTDYHLLSALVERNLFKYYEQENKKRSTKLHQKNVKSTNSSLKSYLISDVARQCFLAKSKRKHDESLQNVSDTLDLFYVTTKLQYSCDMMNRNNVLSTNYDVGLLLSISSKIQSSTIIKAPIVAIYEKIYTILETKEIHTHFDQLKQLIQEHAADLSQIDTHGIYLYAINFCAQMLRKGYKDYSEHALELYVEGIERGVFFEHGYLSPWAFTNVVKIGLNLKPYDWIKNFIDTYTPKLDEKFRENALHYNLAELHYHIKDFDKAIYNLNQVKFSDMMLHVGAREMLARIYYETQEEEALLSLIASFSIFLKRNKNMSANIKKSYLNFCNFLSQLMRKNPKKIKTIKDEIKTNPLLSSRSWLLKIADEIMVELKIKVD